MDFLSLLRLCGLSEPNETVDFLSLMRLCGLSEPNETVWTF